MRTSFLGHILFVFCGLALGAAFRFVVGVFGIVAFAGSGLHLRDIGCGELFREFHLQRGVLGLRRQVGPFVGAEFIC